MTSLVSMSLQERLLDIFFLHDLTGDEIGQKEQEERGPPGCRYQKNNRQITRPGDSEGEFLQKIDQQKDKQKNAHQQDPRGLGAKAVHQRNQNAD